MEPNRQQTFAAPANSKNGVYFMWDFVQRPSYDPSWYLDRTPITLQNMDPHDEEAWDDVRSRSLLACSLILDERPGMLKMMVEGTYPGQANPVPDMGEEVLQATKDLKST